VPGGGEIPVRLVRHHDTGPTCVFPETRGGQSNPVDAYSAGFSFSSGFVYDQWEWMIFHRPEIR
jgi:hypothetical protein